MNKRIYIILLILFISASIFAQRKKLVVEADKGKAKELFTSQNYRQAIDEYLLLLYDDTANITYKHNIAICYLNTNIDKLKAIPYLESITSQPKCDINAWYDLGRAYQYAFRFEDAIKTYNKFISINKGKDINYIPAKRQLEMCNNAIELIKNPINITFENLTNEINSAGADFNPYINSEETFMVFNSKRVGNTGNTLDYDGLNTTDIFYCEFDTKWGKAKRLPAVINSMLSEDCTNMTADETSIIIHVDNEKTLSDIIISEVKGKTFQRPTLPGDMVNSVKDETAACLSPDKQTMIFASNRDGGFGAKDLYICKRLASGDWTTPVNLGDKINTIYDENYPYISPDGETLYFCSVGHNSMGGYDVFKAKWNKQDNTFSEPINIGYPFNTPDDERTVSFTKSGRYAYTSAFRSDGIGDMDLYRVIFNDVPAAYTVFKGNIAFSDVTSSDSTEDKMKTLHNVKITVKEKKTEAVYGMYAPNSYTNNYVVVIIPGVYVMHIEAPGYATQDIDISIPERETQQREIVKNITLIKNNP